MGYHDLYRLSSHAVISNNEGKILQVKATYGEKSWSLPGGALDKGETIHQALYRECLEELGLPVVIEYMSGMYYHEKFNSHALLFRCHFSEEGEIKLSEEHSEYDYFAIEDLSKIQKLRILDCLNFDGEVKSAAF